MRFCDIICPLCGSFFLWQFVGFFFILSASTIISIKKDVKGKTFSSAFFYILVFDLLHATASVLIKYTIYISSFKTIISWESLGLGIGGGLIYIFIPSMRKAFHKSLHTIRKKTIAILAFNDMLFIAGKLLLFLGFASGSVALVSVLEGTQVFFGILYGAILGAIYRNIFKEKISRRAIMAKLIAALLLFEGIVLIS